MKIFAGSTSIDFAKAVAFSAGVKLGSSERQDFSDGEFIHKFNETVRGETVFLIQSTPPLVGNFYELLLMIDAAKRAGATNIVAVIPYLYGSRQDKKDEARVPIGAAMNAKMLESAGVTQIVTMDLHADQIQGMFSIPVSHIYSSSVIIPYLKKLYDGLDITVVSPDMGGSKRAKSYSQRLNSQMAICYKHRTKANQIGEMMVIGEVKDRHVIIVDDIADTAGTLCKAANMLIEKGALSVRAAVAHPVLSGEAVFKINESKIKELIVTDSIPIESGASKIKILTVANLFANVLKSINDGKSISSVF